MRIAIINAGGQTDYLFGLVSGLAKIPKLKIEVIDSNNSEGLFDCYSSVTFHNLRGDQSSNSSLIKKMIRIIKYYFSLIIFAAKTKADIFHIQWENKFIIFDRIFLGFYYKMLGKKVVFTAHNIDTQAREGKSSLINRMTLKFFYWVVDNIIVHTQGMQQELIANFKVEKNKIKIIPHGINNRVSKKGISQEDARSKIGISVNSKVILFFGYIRPSKGLDLLLQSLERLVKDDSNYLLIVAGSTELYSDYFAQVENFVLQNSLSSNVLFQICFVPDSAVEQYFMAADCLVLPYRTIFQTGVIFLSYRFGLPVIVTDVGQLRDDIVEGFTGFVCLPNDSEELAQKIKLYFTSDLYKGLEKNRANIIKYAKQKYSWEKIADITFQNYSELESA